MISIVRIYLILVVHFCGHETLSCSDLSLFGHCSDLQSLRDVVTASIISTSRLNHIMVDFTKCFYSLLDYNLRADCQWPTVVSPFDNGANAAPVYRSFQQYSK